MPASRDTGGNLPRVLFLHSNGPDYLAAGMFHGLRKLLGAGCVDAPRFDCMYAPLTSGMRRKSVGHGFTLYGLLEDFPELPEARFFWQVDLADYDLFIVSLDARWPMFGVGEILADLSQCVAPEKVAILDGADAPTLFPFAWRVLRRNPTYAFSRQRGQLYFKRELTDGGRSYGLERLPEVLWQWLPLPGYARPTAFSIPAEKISRVPLAEKVKDFPRHIVDAEVAARIPAAVSGAGSGAGHWAFEHEADYYADLKSSRYGITTRRGGWDCLRHYELAANGCVLCFKGLAAKPATCAPHGLDRSNCIIYEDYADLAAQIARVDDAGYERLQRNSYDWIFRQTTEARASKLLAACGWGASQQLSAPRNPVGADIVR